MERTGPVRSLQPFPAIDPEPPRRFTARQVRWTAVVAALLAAGVTAGTLTWPWMTAGAAPTHLTAPGFTEHNGVIVFEQQPSGTLGTARPDGSGARMLASLGSLQGTDMAVASPDGHYLVTREAQVVTLGLAGPTSIAFTAIASQLQTNFGTFWISTSFADGGRYVAAAECTGNGGPQWQARLAPLSAGSAGWLLGPADAANGVAVAGDPQGVGAFVVPGAGDCGGQQAPPPAQGDQSVALERPGHAAQTIVTAAAVKQALGVPAATPVLLSVFPSPDGNLLAVTASSFKIEQTQYGLFPVTTGLGVVLVTRTGQVTAKLARPFGFELTWSPDGRRIATVTQASPADAGTIMVWALAGQPASITLHGHRHQRVTGLLWSPDSAQVALAFEKMEQQSVSYAQSLVRGWTVVDLRTGQAHDVTAPGQPVAWLPGRGGGR